MNEKKLEMFKYTIFKVLKWALRFRQTSQSRAFETR